MTAAPLVAIADTKPRSIRSISDRAEPGLDDVRAEAPDDAAVRRAAPSTIARTTALKSAAARMFGSDSSSRPTVAPAATGPREVFDPRLALPRLQRIGSDAGEIEFFVGERHGVSARSCRIARVQNA